MFKPCLPDATRPIHGIDAFTKSLFAMRKLEALAPALPPLHEVRQTPPQHWMYATAVKRGRLQPLARMRSLAQRHPQRLQ